MIDSQANLREYAFKDIYRLAAFLIVLSTIGGLLGVFWYGTCLAIIIFLTEQMRALYRLYSWLRFNPDADPPELSGVWEAIIYNIRRIQRKENQAQEGLKSIISRIQSSLSAIEEAVVLIDSHGLLEWWNPAAEALLGLEPGDRGINILNLIRTPEFREYYYQRSYRQGAKLRSWVSPNKYLQCKITRFGENDRLLFAQDISRLHHLEQVRQDFVANVSHELRTPLTVFSGYLENFSLVDNLNPVVLPIIEQMQQQSERMNELIDDLLHLSRIENDSYQSVKTHINMRALLEGIYQIALDYNQQFNHKISLHIHSEKSLYGSEVDLKTAFSNLIFNAMKYTPAGGKIAIEWSSEEKFARLAIIDNGIGIDSKHIPRLTERFYRVDAGRSQQTGGTGLGLAIVKHALAQDGGYLDIQSTVGKGSIFSCLFPLLPKDKC